MKILIVEDETAAFENLKDILATMGSDVEIAGYTESISQTINWLQNNVNPDLIFMDIHLSDGSAFSIFNSIKLEVPVIFTTAYDEYAIDAFRVNCIDYLLKPIKVEEMKRALDKFRKWTQRDISNYLTYLGNLSKTPRFKDKLLIPVKDQLNPLNMEDISCFYTTDKNTRIFLRDGRSFPYLKTLEQIEGTLNPADFIRANKQFIIARRSVKNITVWFDNRLLINIDIEPPERIYVSKNKAAEFKAWLVNDIQDNS